jgi:predicted Kef-type K+ transport protein
MGARLVGLPPLVGYLVAGFVLFGFGVEANATLREFSEMGVTLLLFSIGLKLRVSGLLMPQIWAVASLHMGAAVLFLAGALYLLAAAGIAMLTQLDTGTVFLVAFALSFSSTVFAVKVLEEKGETGSFYGNIAIGILIMQDIAAVVFLAVSTGKVPSLWALLLFGLIPLRPVLNRVMEKAGHGELLILFGLTLALGGAELFELAGVKGDLGALIIGLLLASYPKASELARHLLGFKDLFLVGFFLVIGLSGPLSLDALAVALLLVLLVPVKVAAFFWLLTRFRLRARTSLLTSLSLANYSEFGLIVAAIGVSSQWLGSEWLIVIAIALSVSFILAAPVNSAAHQLYARYREPLRTWQLKNVMANEQPIDPGTASVLVFGMGRVGKGAYESIRERLGDTVVGIDISPQRVDALTAAGKRVIRGNVVDPDFWSRINLNHDRVRLVMLAMPNHRENLFAAQQLRSMGYRGKLSAIAKYPDEVEALLEAGVDAAYNLYAEAGSGFASDVCTQLLAVEASAPK